MRVEAETGFPVRLFTRWRASVDAGFWSGIMSGGEGGARIDFAFNFGQTLLDFFSFYEKCNIEHN